MRKHIKLVYVCPAYSELRNNAVIENMHIVMPWY